MLLAYRAIDTLGMMLGITGAAVLYPVHDTQAQSLMERKSQAVAVANRYGGVMKIWARERSTRVYVTHNLEEAARLC